MRRLIAGIAAWAALTIGLISCEDNISSIGGSLAEGEVSILVDSVVTDLKGTTEWVPNYDARTTTKLLGRLNIPEYGRLECSFVSQLMSSTKMNVPDSIPVSDVDSLRLIFGVTRGNLTGDSLTPQQMRVYRLPDIIPDTVTSGFDPVAYYGTKGEVFGTKSYTLSNISLGDTAFNQLSSIRIPIKVDDPDFAKDLFMKYRAGDEMFGWPEKFRKYFPGIYVEQNFGNGCVGNITAVLAYLYWHYEKTVTTTVDSGNVAYIKKVLRDSVCLLSSKPEVVSSNNIKYTPSDNLKELVTGGKMIITSPGGYLTHVHFPVDKLVERFNSTHTELTVAAGLSMVIPAKVVKNDYGLTAAPTILMVKTSEREKFFSENKTPDNVISFVADYDSSDNSYHFNNMRPYFIKMKNKVDSGETIAEEDMEFTLMPVNVETEVVSNAYTGQSTTYVLSCSRYMDKPTMTEIDTDKAVIKFSFTTQEVK